jgi:transposase
MKRYVEGENRSQSTLFPESLDNYIAEDNPVRVVDVFVDELDLKTLGFEGAEPEATGRPAYHPATLLKIYIYGYLNRIQSSRRLERETQRNVELIWLTGRLMPDFKTIADFRKENGKAISRVCRKFVVLCRSLGLFSEAIVAIDGSKFKAVNNRDKNFTEHKLKARIQQLDESVTRYLADMDRADRDPVAVTESRIEHLKSKVATVREQIQRLRQISERMAQAPDGQVSLTDPDARSMATSGRGTGIVGYNVQTAVDTQHHLIVCHEVTNVGHDRTQLSCMAKQTRAAVGAQKLVALADRGYFKGEEILECVRAGINMLVPKPQTSNNQAKGGSSTNGTSTTYPPMTSTNVRPVNARSGVLPLLRTARGCTSTGPQRVPDARSKRNARPASTVGSLVGSTSTCIEEMQARLDRMPEASRLRRRTVEHPFGTLKAWMGATHFLTKTLPRVSTEMSLHVLAYNLKRAMQIVGIAPLTQAMRR